jgi:hypothetical protein
MYDLFQCPRCQGWVGERCDRCKGNRSVLWGEFLQERAKPAVLHVRDGELVKVVEALVEVLQGLDRKVGKLLEMKLEETGNPLAEPQEPGATEFTGHPR